MSENKSSKKRVWLLALILTVCVLITTMVVTNIMNDYRLDSSDAIDLVVDSNNSNITDGTNSSDEVSDEDTIGDDSTGGVNSTATTSSNGGTYVQVSNPSHPGFEASDDEQVWTTNTEVSIFKVSYENGVGDITVKSDNGDKLIAPGSENSYTFKFKNTGDVPVEYTLTAEVTIEGTDLSLPVEGRICRHDGDYIVGSKTTYEGIENLHGIEDTYTLAANRYTYYTLDWKWPYEGNDSFDTYLGNLAVDGDITLNIKLNTIATASDTNGGGIIIIDTSTGKDSNIWCISFALLIVMLAFLFIGKDEKEYK